MHFELYYYICTELITIVFVTVPDIFRFIMISILVRLDKTFAFFRILIVGRYIIECIIFKGIFWSKFFRVNRPMRRIGLDKFSYLLFKLSFLLIYIYHFAWIYVIYIAVIVSALIEVRDLAGVIWQHLWIIFIIWPWRNLICLVHLT